MTKAEWHTCRDALEMLRAIRTSVGTRKKELFECACCRLQWVQLSPKCHQLVAQMERHADDPTQPEVGDELVTEFHAARLEAPAQIQGAFDALILSVCGYWEVEPDERADDDLAWRDELYAQSLLVRDIFGNPFRPITLDPSWFTSTVVSLARQMYDSRDFSAMPILADALQDAGCDNADILDHCRGPGPHVRGCFVVDKLLAKE
jgi:hypothetical protein